MNEQEWLTSDDPLAMLRYPLLATEVTNQHAGRYASDRKLRLFVCACCRQVWDRLTNDRSRHAVEIAERYADGTATEQDRIHAWETAIFGTEGLVFASVARCADDNEHIHLAPAIVSSIVKEWFAPTSQAALLRDIFGNPFSPFIKPIGPVCTRCGGKNAILNTKDTFDGWCRDCQQRSTFRWPWMEVLAWNDGTVRHLAEAIYEERRFEDMPVLADALEEAGCNNVDILNHCRWSLPLRCKCGVDWIPVKKNSLPVPLSICPQCHAEGPFWPDVKASQRPVIHVRGCWVLDLLLGKE